MDAQAWRVALRSWQSRPSLIMWLRPPERMATLDRKWSWRTQLCTTAQSRRTNKIWGRKWWDMPMSMIMILMEDGSDDHSRMVWGCIFVHSYTSKITRPHFDLWKRGRRRNNSDKQPRSCIMTFPNTVFSCFHCFSAFLCLFLSPLTPAQLKTELLGSKFNSILEETTVRFLNKSPLKAQVTDASRRMSASPLCTLPFVSKAAFCMAASSLTQTAKLTGNISVSSPVCRPVTTNIFPVWCLSHSSVMWGVAGTSPVICAADRSFCLQGEDGDYQPVGSMAGLEKQELNYAALEFIGARPREGASGRGDDGSNYTEIKAKWIAILPWSLGYARRSGNPVSRTPPAP